MAAVFSPFAFHHGVAGGRPPGAAQARIAFALAVSAFLHTWLAAGIVVEAPERPLPSTARTLTAMLEPIAAPAAIEMQPEGEPALPDRAKRRALQAGSHPLPEHVLPATKRSKPDAPPGAIVTGAAPASAWAPPPAADPTYYSARELDVYPAPLAPLRFEYPERAVRERVGGSVQLMLLLDEAGAVDSVSVVAAEPRGYFEDAARAVLAAARFFPARKDARAVKSRVLIVVNYDPAAAEGALR